MRAAASHESAIIIIAASLNCGFGPGYRKSFSDISSSIACLVLRPFQKVMQRARAVMLRNEIDDPLRQAHLFRQLRAVCDVADYDLRALCGLQSVVRIFASLVLDKMLGRGRFADVVIKRTDPRQQAVARRPRGKLLPPIARQRANAGWFPAHASRAGRARAGRRSKARAALRRSKSQTASRTPAAAPPSPRPSLFRLPSPHAIASKTEFKNERLLLVCDHRDRRTALAAPTIQPATVTVWRLR